MVSIPYPVAVVAELPLLERLEPHQRLMVVVGLALIVLLMLPVYLLTRAGGRWARRVSREKVKPIDRGLSDWSGEPIDSPAKRREK